MAAPAIAAVAIPTMGRALATDLFVYRTTLKSRRKGRPPDELEFHLNGVGILAGIVGVAVAKWVINGMPWPGSSSQGGFNPLLGPIIGPAVDSAAGESKPLNTIIGLLTGSWWSPWW